MNRARRVLRFVAALVLLWAAAFGALGCFDDGREPLPPLDLPPAPPEVPDAPPSVAEIPFSISNPNGAWLDAITENIRRRVADGRPLAEHRGKMAEIARAIEPRAGDTIADVGCGTGLLAVYLLENDVQFRRLYALDTDPFGLTILQRMLRESGLAQQRRVYTVLSSADDSGLPRRSIDLAVVSDMPFFHARPDPAGGYAAMIEARANLASLRAALKRGARLHVFASRVGVGQASAAARPDLEATFLNDGFNLTAREYLPAAQMFHAAFVME
jgi:SAM-dependent methyltransferase